MAAMTFYAPIALAVAANLLYHSAQKLTPAAAHPLLTIGLSFATAAALALGGYALTSGQTFAAGLRSLSWTTVGLGVSVLLIETAFLLAYRRGWPIGVTSLVVVAGQTALLIPLGRLVFAEKLSAASWVGALLCLAGLAIISLAPRFG